MFYECPQDADQPGLDYQRAGRIDAEAIREHALLADADYYLCGPQAFMQQQRAQLRACGVAAARIHMEVFGSNAMASD